MKCRLTEIERWLSSTETIPLVYLVLFQANESGAAACVATDTTHALEMNGAARSTEWRAASVIDRHSA